MVKNWISTNFQSEAVNFKAAVLSGLADDGGLFVPIELSRLTQAFISDLSKYSFQEVACELARSLIGEEIPGVDIQKLVSSSCNFSVPIVKLEQNLHVLELFHGPTQAFKDFGARFFGELLSYFLSHSAVEKNTVVLVATSGDTGGAVASGLWQRPGIKVVVLYPKGKVSEYQQAQMSTLGGNVVAVEVSGNFDDCQKLVKQAFLDSELRKILNFTSANSINIARLIPQSFYYAQALAQLRRTAELNKEHHKEVIFVVPSGNLGNLTAGVLCLMLGLPIKKLVAACNSNDTYPNFLKNRVYSAKPSKHTLSSAMDVGDPSNFARLSYLFKTFGPEFENEIAGLSVNDQETQGEIASIYARYGYMADPHTAVGLYAAEKIKPDYPDAEFVVLSTAHPIKFAEIVEGAIGVPIERPGFVDELMNKPRVSESLANDFQELKSLLTKLV